MQGEIKREKSCDGGGDVVHKMRSRGERRCHVEMGIAKGNRLLFCVHYVR